MESAEWCDERHQATPRQMQSARMFNGTQLGQAEAGKDQRKPKETRGPERTAKGTPETPKRRQGGETERERRHSRALE